ncbi:hypothetical protein [Streptomyces phaeochromogenes]|uniref:hypothetical protein n=1 Tax=Streptomyces phaeochromogenes TaxID=1923 RepID=UPI003403ADF2
MTTHAFDFHDKGPLPGISDLVPTGRDLTDSEIDRIGALIDEADLPLQVSLGSRDRWGAVLNAISQRELVEELPPEEQVLPWLEAHAPPGGSTTVRIDASASTEKSFRLNIFGSGLGGGRQLEWDVSNEYGPNTDCATYASTVMVQASIYREGADTSPQTSEVRILKHLNTAVKSRPREQCPWCAGPSSDATRVRYEPEPAHSRDLRGLAVPATVSLALKAGKGNILEAGFGVPQLGVSLKLIAKAHNTDSIRCIYQLPARRISRAFSYRAPPRHQLHSLMWNVNMEGSLS